MTPLILDFARRWWWMVTLFVVFTMFVSWGGVPVAFTLVAMICLVFDGQRGVFRCVRPLPIPSRTQALAWWMVAIPIPSLVGVIPAVAGTALYAHHAPPGTEPWFLMAVSAWMGVGWASLYFMLAACLPTRAPKGFLETGVQILVGMCWGVMLPGSMLLMQFLPKTLHQVTPGYWAMFAAVPPLFILSAFAAPAMVSRRSTPFNRGVQMAPAAAVTRDQATLTGVPLYVVTFGGRVLLIMSAMALVQFGFLRLIAGGSGENAAQGFQLQLTIMAVIFVSFMSESAGMRGLRTLPISTAKLAWLLSSIPVAVGVLIAMLLPFFAGDRDPESITLTTLCVRAIAISGCSILTTTAVLHISGGTRFFVGMILAVGAGLLMQVATHHPAAITAAGLLAGIGGFVLLLRGLRYSMGIYQPRRFFGNAAGTPFGGC